MLVEREKKTCLEQTAQNAFVFYLKDYKNIARGFVCLLCL